MGTLGLFRAAAAAVVGCTCASVHAAPIDTIGNGLQLHYSMDSVSGNSIPDDAGSVNDSGTLSNPANPVLTTGKFGNALMLASPTSTTGTYVSIPKVGDLVKVTDGTSTGNAVTVSMWVNVSSSNTGTNNSFFDSANDGYGFFGTSAGISFKVTDGADTTKNTRATSTGINVFNTASNTIGWVHLLGTYDGSNVAIWVNGTKFTGTAASYPYLRTQDAFLAADHAAANTLLTGAMDDVAVWNRALTDSEVAYLYNAGTGNAVPEPTTLSLLGVGGWLLLRRPRNAR